MKATASVQTGHPVSQNSPSKPGAMLGLSLGYFMVLLDTTVVSVALPAIQNELGGGIAGLQWVVNAYTIVFAGLLLSMGAFSDKLGARRVYSWGLIVFLIASAAASASPSLLFLIGMRALLGVGGAALLPASLALLAHTFTDPQERARAMGLWAAITGTAMAAGPVVGGLLVDSLGWRAIFVLQVPLAALSLFMTWRSTRETARKQQQSFDTAGQMTAIVGIGSLSFALMEGGQFGWQSTVTLAAFGLALAGIAAFVYTQTKARSPLLPLRLFRSKDVSAGMIAGMAINVGLSGILFLIPLYFQQLRGLSAHMAGFALLPMTLPLAFNPIVTGKIVARTGPRKPMTAGFLLAASGTAMQAGHGDGTSYLLAWTGLLLIGFGVSFTIPALMTAVISSAPRELTGTASGALNSSRQLGAVLGVAAAGSLLEASASFTAGMHAALYMNAGIMLAGAALSWTAIGSRGR